MEYNILHNEAESRFEITIDNLTALVEYRRVDNILIVTHTGVPQALEGRGIAAALTKVLLDYARNNDLKVRPVCPYTKAYIQRHPEYRNIVSGG